MPTRLNKPIYVTVPSLAPLEEYKELLDGVWERRILTHNGPLVQRLEKELEANLGLRNLVAVTNGTIAIQLAIKALKLRGEIITTPFTYVATICAIQWENCTPVFVDINPETFNINPQKIEDAITHGSRAIMPVHVFSNPCNIEDINYIAKKYNLIVIYDAAHAMAVNYKERSILEYGDISATSFHATKLFNTGEGGACVTKNYELYERLRSLRFFGHNDEKNIIDDGFNGKMTEVHAALGLANLRHLDEVLSKRKLIFKRYFERLNDIDYITFQKFDRDAYNYNYMPILISSEELLLDLVSKLNKCNIYPRRYFYPSLNTINAIKPYTPMPISEDIAKRVLCLPSYNDLNLEMVNYICDIIKD